MTPETYLQSNLKRLHEEDKVRYLRQKKARNAEKRKHKEKARSAARLLKADEKERQAYMLC
jgi:hypothetical protein